MGQFRTGSGFGFLLYAANELMGVVMRKLGCILLVDDNINDNFYHIATIRDARAAHQIKTATDGEKALAYLEKGHELPDVYPFPDLIFLDIKMPGVDGFEFLERLREKTITDHIKPVIIIMTNSLNANDEKIANEKYVGDITAFVNKPLTVKLLESIIEKFF